MRVVIFIVTVTFVTAANDTASFRERCLELLNSNGSYAYCNVTTDTSQEVDIKRLDKLYRVADNLSEVFEDICDEHGDKICADPCDNPEDEIINLSNDRDNQNDLINGQLIDILKHSQQFDAPCAAEQSKVNSSLLDVCTVLKPKLQLLGQNISDYLEVEKCGCIEGKCYYEPGREVPDDGKIRTLRQVFCDSYNTVELTERIFNATIVHRNMSIANSPQCA